MRVYILVKEKSKSEQLKGPKIKKAGVFCCLDALQCLTSSQIDRTPVPGIFSIHIFSALIKNNFLKLWNKNRITFFANFQSFFSLENEHRGIKHCPLKSINTTTTPLKSSKVSLLTKKQEKKMCSALAKRTHFTLSEIQVRGKKTLSIRICLLIWFMCGLDPVWAVPGAHWGDRQNEQEHV